MIIDRFTDEFNFLSNFHPSPIVVEGVLYPAVEHAYQALKTVDKNERIKISFMTSGQAKRAGRKLKLRENWESIKLIIMEICLREKFKDPTLKAMLDATKPYELQEGNNWGDTIWGTVDGEGQNLLGQLLMKIRDE